MTICDFLKFIFNAGDIYSKKLDTKRYTMISLSIPGLSRNILSYQFPSSLWRYSMSSQAQSYLFFFFFPFKCEFSHCSESCLFPFRVWEAERCPAQRCMVQIPRTCECAHLHGKRNSANVMRHQDGALSRWTQCD